MHLLAEIDRLALKNWIRFAMAGARRTNVLMQSCPAHGDLHRRLNEVMLRIRRMEYWKGRYGADE
jgi:hypothetical protein